MYPGSIAPGGQLHHRWGTGSPAFGNRRNLEMKRLLMSTFAILTLAGSGLVATADSASAAASAITCKKVFDDGNTAGINCTGGGPFNGFAKCKNGKYAIGATAASGTTSYAYCTSYNSSLASPCVWGGSSA
jgi:hypothetical protein